VSWTALALVLAAASSSVGCEQQTSDTPTPKQAPPARKLDPVPLVWGNENRLKSNASSAVFKLTTSPDQVPLQLQGVFRDWPRMTTFAFGTEQGRGEDGNWSASLDIKALVHAQPIDALRQPVDLQIAVTVTAPDHAPAVTMLPKLDVRGTLRLLLLQVQKAGISFGTGDTAVERPRGIAVISGASGLNFVGAAKTTQELDWIAIAEDRKEPSGRKSCWYERGGLALIRFYDTDMTLFDRRSGKKLKSVALQRHAECPPSVIIDPEKWGRSSVLEQDIVRWTERQFAQSAK